MEGNAGAYTVNNPGKSATMYAADPGKRGSESIEGQGVGSMQYQGSGMAPHEPLHPSASGSAGNGGFGGEDSCGCEEESAENNMGRQGEMGNGVNPQGMYGSAPQGGGVNPQGMYGSVPQGGGVNPQGMYGSAPLGGGVNPQGMYGSAPLGGGVNPQGMYGSAPQGGGVNPQGMYGSVPQGGGVNPQGMYGSAPLGGGVNPQGMYGSAPQGGGVNPQGMYGSAPLGGGVYPQGMYGSAPQGGGVNPQGVPVQNMYSQESQSAVGDMNRFGQYLGVINDIASGKTPELPEVAQMVQQAPGDFWKGAIVGVAAGLLLTSESVRNGLGSVIGAVFSGVGREQDAEEKEEERD